MIFRKCAPLLLVFSLGSQSTIYASTLKPDTKTAKQGKKEKQADASWLSVGAQGAVAAAVMWGGYKGARYVYASAPQPKLLSRNIHYHELAPPPSGDHKQHDCVVPSHIFSHKRTIHTHVEPEVTGYDHEKEKELQHTNTHEFRLPHLTKKLLDLEQQQRLQPSAILRVTENNPQTFLLIGPGEGGAQVFEILPFLRAGRLFADYHLRIVDSDEQVLGSLTESTYNYERAIQLLSNPENFGPSAIEYVTPLARFLPSIPPRLNADMLEWSHQNIVDFPLAEQSLAAISMIHVLLYIIDQNYSQERISGFFVALLRSLKVNGRLFMDDISVRWMIQILIDRSDSHRRSFSLTIDDAEFRFERILSPSTVFRGLGSEQDRVPSVRDSNGVEMLSGHLFQIIRIH